MSAASLPRTVTAAEIARAAGIDPKTFRAALRRANLNWHAHYEKWEVPFGSAGHSDMSDVLASLTLSEKPRGHHFRAPAPFKLRHARTAMKHGLSGYAIRCSGNKPSASIGSHS